MPTRGAVPAFEQLARVYDESREVPEARVLDHIARQLRDWQMQTILEVGVGTGRIAVPLSQRGLAMTGVDASGEMLRRARDKGVARSVLGDAYLLPFKARSFDAALFVHVLHLLEEPRAALEEAVRVSRHGVVALVEPESSAHPDRPTGEDREARTVVFEALRRMGYTVPQCAGKPKAREREVLQRFPPDRLVILNEQDVTEPLAQELEFLRRGGSRWTLEVPSEALERAVAEARAQVGSRTFTYRRVQALAQWEVAPR